MMFKNEQAVKDYSIATDTGSEEQMKIAVYCGSTAGNREAFTIGGSRAWRMDRGGWAHAGVRRSPGWTDGNDRRCVCRAAGRTGDA